ncbi:hypothetical protein QFC24_005403 [Naganishia onofrii]|uniref:Uncharacterized protein n=1 Tax=Naganishia onofrii TaxID=1851511 RepID=A0ACC2X794_9TREE|nr:hypothetical protein QFC24_005403 [Naganishia onofrii]
MAAAAYMYDSRSAIHEHVAMPVLRVMTDAETSHKLAVKLLAMSSWVRPKDRGTDAESIRTELFGLPLNNPVGLAAGFDKDAQAVDGLFDLGFAYVEVGSITPEPQPGNPQPRFFRLEEDQACINRYGFNSLGHRHALHQLQGRIRNFALDHPSLFPNPLPLNPLPPSSLPRSLRPGCLLAVNLGKNKSSSTASNTDYVAGVRLLGPYADILVVNVSSPNTPGLRGLQGKSFLTKLLQDVVLERDQLPVPQALKPKIVVKIAPDLDEQEIEDVADSIRSSGVDGVIVSNTTVKRAGLDLQSVHAAETGGLSGKPVKPLSILTLSALRALLPTSIPIIGCGGISDGDDAVDFLNAGADMVQAYTAFGYTGVGFARKLKDEITANLEQHSTSWMAEVEKNRRNWVDGADHLTQQLKAEVSRLKRAMNTAPSLIPIEDLAAASGLDSDDLSATEEDSSPIFGSMKVISQRSYSDSSGTTSTHMRNLDASLHPFASAVIRMTEPLMGHQPEPLHMYSTNRDTHNCQPGEPASPPHLEDLSWRDSVNQGDRRLV